MKHLITGGSGFLGSLIVESLVKRGDTVVSLDIWEAPDRNPQVEFVLGSILDRELMRKTIKGVDVVHHSAALVPLTKAGRLFHEVNVEGTRITAEEAARANVSFFVHTSSSTVFGCPSSCPVDNSKVLEPVEEYGMSKLGAEQVAKEVSDHSGMPLIVVRPRTMVGVGRLGIFQILFEWIKEHRNIYVIGDGSNKIQFLHGDDLIDCYMFLCEKKQPGFYNVGTDRFDTLEITLGNLIKHAQSTSNIRHLPKTLTIQGLAWLDALNLSPLAPWHYLTYAEDFYFDMKPLLDLGWKPRYSNDEMLKVAYDDFVQNYKGSTESQSATNSAHRKKVKEKVLWLLKQIP